MNSEFFGTSDIDKSSNSFKPPETWIRLCFDFINIDLILYNENLL